MDKSFLRSIRFKIILLYMLVLVVTLSLFSLLLYINFSNTLYNKVDATLLLKSDGIEKAIRTYWKTEKLEMTATWASSHIFSKKKDENFEKIAGHLTEGNVTDDEHLSEMVVHIFDAKGALIATSKNIPEIAFLKKKDLESIDKGQKRFDDFDIPFSDGKTRTVRSLTLPIIEQKELKYIVRVTASLVHLQAELDRLRGAVFFRVPVVVLIASLAGIFLVKATLSPVDEMVDIIRKIRPDNLKPRIQVPDTNDEITRLAETFNEMLGILDKSFTSQRQIIQDISHELKTPLTILRGQLEVAVKKERTVEEYKGVLYSSLEEIEKIRRIVDSLLILARLDSQGLTMEMKPLELNTLILSVLEDLKILADSKKIEVVFIARAKIMLTANDIHLKRLFVNLFENAIKYTPYGGKVTVELDQTSQLVNIHISDTGIGIPEKDLPHIFDRFYRVDKARSGGEGFGLGLSIVKSIVQAHKGRISVKSQWGKGTTFNIHLPLAA